MFIDKFWDTIAGDLADEWTARLAGPALVFWGGGLLVWISRFGWEPLLTWLASFDTAQYLLLVSGGILLLAISNALMIWLQLSLLRFLEGYWQGPLYRLRFFIARRWVTRHVNNLRTNWRALVDKGLDKLSDEERAKYAWLDAERATYPVDPRDYLPTQVGNVLRAAETYSSVRYGLELSTIWPRLWLLLPTETQKEITEARKQLNEATGLFWWAILFTVWVVWAWWVPIVAYAAAVIAMWRIISAAEVYAVLIRTAFDLHRFALYKQMEWSPPTDLKNEKDDGERLTNYLFRGEFTPPPENPHPLGAT
jgi:hypothetical protein